MVDLGVLFPKGNKGNTTGIPRSTIRPIYIIPQQEMGMGFFCIIVLLSKEVYKHENKKS